MYIVQNNCFFNPIDSGTKEYMHKIKKSDASIPAQKKLAFEISEKSKRAAELIIANVELAFQKEEKGKRAAELIIANVELAYQNEEKEKRAAELIIATKVHFSQRKKDDEYIGHLAAIVESSDDAIISKTLDGIIKSWNRGGEKMFGYTANEAIGKHISLIIPPEYSDEEKTIVDKIRNNDIIEHYETVRTKKNGEQFYVSLTVSPLKDRAGSIIGCSKIARDISARKKSEAELIQTNKELAFQIEEKEKRSAELTIANVELAFQNKEKEKRAEELVIANVELAFQNQVKEKRAAELIIANKKGNELEELLRNNLKEISDYKYVLDESSIIAITDQNGIIKKVNNNFCLISKYSEKELVGQDHRIINSGYHSKEVIRNLWLTITSGKIWRGEIKNKAKDGSFYWVDTVIVPFLDDKGCPYQYLASRADITTRKETEEYLIQRTAQLEMANKKLVFQHEEKEKRAEELILANNELAYQNQVKEKRAAELVMANEELAFQNHEKEKRAAELNIANIELAFQNEEKEKRAEELSIANKELQAFSYISSHDLQEPLRKIQIFTTIILENENQNLSENGKYNFHRIQFAVGTMRQLIDDLLSFSSTNSAERKFEKTNLDIIIAEIIAELKENIEEKHAIIETTELGICNIIVFQFRQLMYNLISNALKFSKTDVHPHVIIKSSIVKGSKLRNVCLNEKVGKEKFLPKKNYYHISVQDNGIGFETHYSERIFEVFQRLHSKEKYAGTGIGLAIVKKIVENHNGIIKATSQLNKGATFDIYIPISDEENLHI